jgi:hypothetical protein
MQFHIFENLLPFNISVNLLGVGPQCCFSLRSSHDCHLSITGDRILKTTWKEYNVHTKFHENPVNCLKSYKEKADTWM